MRSSACCTLLALVVGMAGAQAAEAPSPTRQQVEAALAEVKNDPNLPGTRIEQKLQFKEDDKKPEPDEPKPAKRDPSRSRWGDWLAQLSEGARWLVWGAMGLLVLWVLVRCRRWWSVRGVFVRQGADTLPSHVRSLDIRPESLPPSVGDEAAGLWQRGEDRAALSLLYRGALSRLVHGDALPIAAASTEGECVALAAQALAPERAAFFERLVQAWQLAVYGARRPSTETVLALCAGFDDYLPGPALSGVAR